MNTPLFKPLKTNGTTLYVFPSVAEDKNYEKQNETYKMQLSHFVLLNFPREVANSKLDFDSSFYQNGSSIAPADFKDRLVESLRNYVANHSTVIRNSKINSNEFYYDSSEIYTPDEKIFWKWCKSVGIIDFEPADPINEYFGLDPNYDDNGPIGNTDYFREYLWRERDNTIKYDLLNSMLPSLIGPGSTGYNEWLVTLTASTTFKPGDYVLINKPNLDAVPHYSTTYSLVKVVAVSTNVTTNDQITIEIDNTFTWTDFTDVEINSAYNRFVQMIGEISGINNVQHPDRAYTETFAQVSYQIGMTPYALWKIMNDNNYKPNSTWPILPSEIQGEIQGGEFATNPILTNPTEYPGDIWAQFDGPASFVYTTKTGNILKRSGDYYGITATNNTSPTLLYPDFDGSLLDGLTLDLNIQDYAKATSYAFPIESFNEFAATAFNNEAPKDFEFNAVLWYYTIEDTTGNETRTSTNIYGIEFLDTPNNDIVQPTNKNWIPTTNKYVSNGYQDGTSYTFTLDLNYVIDSDVQPPTFDPDKIYSLFGMELFYEAMTRMTYFNDQLTDLISQNQDLYNKIQSIQGLVYTQQDLESIRQRMNNLENLLNVYSTLQIGNSSTIEPYLDTSVVPPLLRLNSVDKQYGYVYSFNTKDMFIDFLNVNNLTDYSVSEKTVPVVSGKDFLVVVNNNDYNVPTVAYDTTVLNSNLSIVLEKDLQYKQKIDILIIPKSENITDGEPIYNKKLNLNINYDDSIGAVKRLIKTFDLPTFKSLQGSTRIDEYSNSYDVTPIFNVKNIKYSTSTSERYLEVTVEDDLVYSFYDALTKRMQQSNRIFLDNFFLNSDPSTPTGGTYTDLSGQYELSIDADYVKSEIFDIELKNPGYGYLANQTNVLIPISIPNSTQLTESIIVSTDSNGKISNAELVTNNTKRMLPTDSGADYGTVINVPTGSYNDINGTPVAFTTVPSINAEFVFKVKKVTRLKLIFKNYLTDPTLNTLLTSYDTAFGISSWPLGTSFDLKQYCKVTPSLTFLKGWKISMVRISDINNVPFTQLSQRYDIKIDKL